MSSWAQIIRDMIIQDRFEQIADFLFEQEINDIDSPYRAKRDLNTIYGDDAGYQYLADWITE